MNLKKNLNATKADTNVKKQNAKLITLIIILVLILCMTIIGIVVGLFAFSSIMNDVEQASQPTEITIQTRGKSISLAVEIADSEEERAYGLMYREELDENSGMIFIYDTEQEFTFWMKNTLIPLDIIYINSQGEIVHIVKDTTPNQTEEVYPSTVPAQYVIEVNAGWSGKNNIQLGDTVIMEGVIYE